MFDFNSSVSRQGTLNVFNEGLFIPGIYSVNFGNKSLQGCHQIREIWENQGIWKVLGKIRGKTSDLGKIRENQGILFVGLFKFYKLFYNDFIMILLMIYLLLSISLCNHQLTISLSYCTDRVVCELSTKLGWLKIGKSGKIRENEPNLGS